MTKQERIRELAAKSVTMLATDIFCKIPKNKPITPELCAEIMADTERLQAALELTQYGEAQCSKAQCSKAQNADNTGFIECGGLLWLHKNMGADGREYYTFDKASEVSIPTKEELEDFVERTYYAFDKPRKCGIFTDRDTGVRLELPANGFIGLDGGAYSVGTRGYYWSDTEHSDDSAYFLMFDEDGAAVNCFNYGKKNRLSARLIIRY